jgi:hypothetical protein
MELVGVRLRAYKSVEYVELPLEGLTVLGGPNGVGKSNLLEALVVHDPASRTPLARDGQPLGDRPSADLTWFVRFSADKHGDGPDASDFAELLLSDWGQQDWEIMWLGGSDFSGDEQYGVRWWDSDSLGTDRPTGVAGLRAMIDGRLHEGVPGLAAAQVTHFLDTLWDYPTVAVGPDLSVRLVVDRRCPRMTAVCQEAQALLERYEFEGPAYEVLKCAAKVPELRWSEVLVIAGARY